MKKIKLIVPENWGDITIEQYQKFMKVLDSNKKEKQKNLEIVSIFCDIEVELLKKFKLKDLNRISDIIIKMTKDDPSDIAMQKNIEFDGDDYGVIPNMSNMTTGEFIDLETYCENSVDNLHKIMSIIYRKQKDAVDRNDRYEIEDYKPTEEKKDLMLKLPMNYALGVLNFFFHLGDKLIKDSGSYLVRSR